MELMNAHQATIHSFRGWLVQRILFWIVIHLKVVFFECEKPFIFARKPKLKEFKENISF
jgi:hypothetical protein